MAIIIPVNLASWRPVHTPGAPLTLFERVLCPACVAPHALRARLVRLPAALCARARNAPADFTLLAPGHLAIGADGTAVPFRGTGTQPPLGARRHCPAGGEWEDSDWGIQAGELAGDWAGSSEDEG